MEETKKAMNREEAREQIKGQIKCENFLNTAKNGGYICPFCGSGTGEHATGAMTVYKETNTFTCFACNKSGDIIDLYREITGTDYNTALQELTALTGSKIDENRPQTPQTPQKPPTNAENAASNEIILQGIKMQENENKSKTDYTVYFDECKKQLQRSTAAQDYLRNRGISQETFNKYNIGFDNNEQRVIIPANKNFYVARTINNNERIRYKNPKGAAAALFNINCINEPEAQEVFVVEGAFDALSVIEMGKIAIALNSTSNVNKLIEVLKKAPTDKTIILSLDNDSAGQKKQHELIKELEKLNIVYITADLCSGCKDANEALTTNPALFLRALNKATAAAQEAQAAALKPNNTALYIDKFMQRDIERQKANKLKTCFDNLNKKAGGIYSGLYIIAANTSIGKTTFTLQLADGIAASGKDVLYFSLEQSKLELVSKSLARYAAALSLNREEAPTSLQIRRGEWKNISAAETIQKYKNDIGDRINIIEGNFNCDVEYIKNETRNFVNRNKCRPVVIVDYFQILQATADKRQTLRESIDYNATELKRLSRELDITIILISSVNRNSYYNHFTAAALKESGGIEYTADCIWGLQLETMQNQEFTSSTNGQDKRDQAYKEAIAETPRQIQLICVKNRYGISNFDCSFEYYPAHDLFCAKKELCGAANGWEELPPIERHAIKI